MKIIAVLMLIVVSACGFTPVYSPTMQSGKVEAGISSIAIDTIPDREGQMVRNHLIDRLQLNGTPANPEYRLMVSPIQEDLIEIGIDKNDEASRAQLRESATFDLIRLSDNKTVYTRTVRSVAGYNILGGQFTTFINEQDTREQALRALADNIVTDLEIYFSR